MSSVDERGERKVTSGITELSPFRVQIDRAVCYLDVGRSDPAIAAGGKGVAVRQLKGNPSWV